MKLFCYGASGHGKVVADILTLSGADVLGFVDDDAAKTGTRVAGVPVLGTAAILPELVSQGAAIVTIGSNRIRTEKARELERLGFQFASALHPSAIVARDSSLGPGTVIMAGAVVNAGAILGAHVIVNTGATVDHDCVLADGVHVSPGASLAGGVTVGRNSQIGVRAAVIQGIRIGGEAIVGAGAVVIRDVAAGSTVVGSPARPLPAKDGLSSSMQKVLISPRHSIRETLEAIDGSGLAIALVVDEQCRLLGTVTDGDVRRAILRGNDVNAPVSAIMNREPTTVTAAYGLDQVRELMLASSLKHAVVTDQENRVTNLITMADVLCLPHWAPDINDGEIQSATRRVWGRSQPHTGARDFEEKLAACAGRRYAVAVNSGGAGLHLLLRALRLASADEVMIPSFHFGATGDWLAHAQVRVRPAEIDGRSYNLDFSGIESAMTGRTRAVLAVDTLGQPADYERIQAIAARHRLSLIIDARQSLGAEYKHRRASSHGIAAVLGFPPEAQITTGEGGAIVTDEQGLAEACRSLAYHHGLADLNCALGLAQLERLDEVLERRQCLAELYDLLLEGQDQIVCPWLTPETTRMSWYGYVIRLGPDFSPGDRDRVITLLRQDGIAANPGFSFPLNRNLNPVAALVAERTVDLPFHGQLRRQDAEWVVRKLLHAAQAVHSATQPALPENVGAASLSR